MKSIKSFLPGQSVIRPVPFEQEKKMLIQEIRKISPKIQIQFGSALKIFTGRMSMQEAAGEQANESAFWVDFSANPDAVQKEIRALIQNERNPETGKVEGFCKVFLLSAQILLKATVIQVEGTVQPRLKFIFPSQVFKVHRRKHLRVPMPKETEGWVKFPDLGDRRIIDISLMGARVQIQAEDERHLGGHRKLNALVFRLGNKSVETQCEVRYLDSRIVGLSIEWMNPVDRAWLKDFLLSQIRMLLNDPAQILESGS